MNTPLLNESDVAPILDAIDDCSPQVQEAALKVLALLRPLIRSSAIDDRLTGMMESPDANISALARSALEGAARSSRHDTIDDRPVPVETGAPAGWTWGTPERAREIVVEPGDPYRRLDAALDLAAIGDTTWVEPIVDDIERAPWDLAALGALRSSHRPLLPPDLIQRFRDHADDPARRGDIRQLAHLLASGAADDRVPPDTPDLARNAAAIADEYLSHHDRVGIDWRETEAFRYLDPERASLLITVSFARCLEAAFSHDMGYAVGNDIGGLLAAFADRFVPDVPALFEIYVEMFRFAAAGRAEWYRTQDEYVVFRSNHLAVCWQMAWTLGRSGLIDSIAALVPFLDPAEEEQDRVAALQLLEDVIRFLPLTYFPVYGGVTEPEMDAATIVQSVSVSLASASEAVGYRTVRVFYGTNRRPTGIDRPARRYGTASGDLELGICEVSMPAGHDIGTLESPPLYGVNWRSNPARYVVLLRVECQERSTFGGALKQSVKASKDRQVLVFVHGYRVSFEDAAQRTAQLGDDLQIATPVFFSWPSRGKMLAYEADAVMAERAVPRLVEFIDLVAAESGADVIHLIAHSMGSVALSRAVIEYLATRKPGQGPKMRELILAAPDIDAEVFRDQIVPKISGRGLRMTLYASRRDYALLASRWLRSGLSRAGFIEGGTPLVVPGVETVDVSAVNTEWLWGLLQGHSYVGDRVAIVQDMSDLLRFGRTASERFGNRSSMSNGLPYWIMKPRSA